MTLEGLVLDNKNKSENSILKRLGEKYGIDISQTRKNNYYSHIIGNLTTIIRAAENMSYELKTEYEGLLIDYLTILREDKEIRDHEFKVFDNGISPYPNPKAVEVSGLNSSSLIDTKSYVEALKKYYKIKKNAA